GEISVWKTKVTLTCPEIGKWYKDDTVITEKTDDADLEIEEKSHTFTYEGKTTFHCEYTSEDDKPTKYYFRFEGKVCEDCYEVDARLIGLVIIVDIVGTALLMILICSCTQNKSSAGPAHSSKAPARSGGRPTPASSSEYEQLNRQTRSQDTYSVVNRTG
uniref:T-cell surface glycoprotein CD3 epsilon chain-like n=1 Tax=Acanthochromis polyacanthus TaxID=80966 RepID=A0A3Q1GGS3_9TELE